MGIGSLDTLARRKQERKDELLWSVDDIRPRFFFFDLLRHRYVFLCQHGHTHISHSALLSFHKRMKALAIHDLWTDEEKEGDCLDIRNVGWVEHSNYRNSVILVDKLSSKRLCSLDSAEGLDEPRKCVVAQAPSSGATPNQAMQKKKEIEKKV